MNQNGITIITPQGEQHFGHPNDLYAELNRLCIAVGQSNLDQAKAYFALGEMLVKSLKEMKVLNPAVSMRHLINDSGVHPQKAKRSIKWYGSLADPETGAFSTSLYGDAVHQVAESVEAGTQKASFDNEKNPSIRAISDRIGLNGPKAQRGCLEEGCSEKSSDTCVPDQPYDKASYVDPNPDGGTGMLTMLDGLDDDLDDELDEPVAPRLALTPGAAGEQLMIDFDFRAAGLSIHEQLDHAAQMLDNDELDPAIAAGLEKRTRELEQYIKDSIQEAVA